MPSRRASTISTRDLRGLPGIDALRRLCQSLALLDSILEPEWEFRYYSFNSRWSRGRRMASMRNGQGDEWFIQFERRGAAMKGFDHESPMADPDNCPWPGVLDSVPKAFASFRKEPAFSMQDTMVIQETAMWAHGQQKPLRIAAADILCQDLRRKLTGARPSDAYFRDAAKLADTILAGGFETLAGVPRDEIMMKYERK